MTKCDFELLNASNILDYLKQGNLKNAVRLLELTTEKFPNKCLAEEINTLREDLNRIVTYWRQDAKDPLLQQFLDEIKRHIFDLYMDSVTLYLNEADSGFLNEMKKKANKKGDSWEWEEVRRKLENYVSEEALASLGIDDDTDRYYRIYDDHMEYLQRLFYHLATMGQLKNREVESIKQLLLTPTVDSVDQQVIVTALMLTGLRTFDIRKFDILAHTVLYSEDVRVKERALVGFVFSMGTDMQLIFPEYQTIFDSVMDHEELRDEVLEMQMQVIYSMNAKADSRTLREEIMPEMMKNMPFKYKNGKIEEKEEDPMDDILGNDKTEKIEEKMHIMIDRMNDMRNKGADLFFSDFAQVKDYPFFSEMCNWFLPFSINHKEVRKVATTQEIKNIIELFTRESMTCDSDNYSYAFAFAQVANKMPTHILEALSTVPTTSLDEDLAASIVRRNYIQSLYRFFNLFKWTNGYFTPFSYNKERYDTPKEKSECVFMLNPLFVKAPWFGDLYPSFLLFFSKYFNKDDKEWFDAITRVTWPMAHSFEGEMAMGVFLLKLNHQVKQAEECFRLALKHRPNSAVAMKKLAYTLNGVNDEEAFQLLMNAQGLQPDNEALCFDVAKKGFETGHFEEVIPLLYELYYKRQDDREVKEMLASSLLLNGQIDKSEEIFDKVYDKRVEMSEYTAFYVAATWLKTDSVRQTHEMINEKDIDIESVLTASIWERPQGKYLRKLFDSHGISVEETYLLFHY